MGSAGVDVMSLEEIESGLKDVGNKLKNHLYSTMEELLDFLIEAQTLLSSVINQPAWSTKKAILPLLMVLQTDEILQHTNINIQIGVAMCTTDVTRITAPQWPYNDDIMEVVFKLFMVSIEKLFCESPCYAPEYIIVNIAKTRSCLMMMDLPSSGLIEELFQLFLDNIRYDHAPTIFESMLSIMKLVIEEDIEEKDKISPELLNPLLASVRMDNKNLSPASWELGTSVFEKCATIIQPHVREAVKHMNLKIDDYAEIVISLCRDTSDEENMNKEENEVSPTHQFGVEDSKADQLSEAEKDVPSPETKDSDGDILDGENLSETHQIVQLKSNSEISDMEHAEATVQAETNNGTIRSKRGRKPNLIFDNSWIKGSSKKGSVSEVSRKGQSKKKESMINQQDDPECSSSVIRRIMQKKLNIGKNVVAGPSHISPVKEEGKDELLLEQQSGKKESEVVVEKMVVSPICKPTKTKTLAQEKEKNTKRPVGDFADELVNSRVQIWWPDDKMFYAGTVTTFDPSTEKHMITYDDNEMENLNLKEERWELLSREQPKETEFSRKGKEIAGPQSPAEEPVKSREKTAKRKAGPLNKEHDAASSSKRPKSESLSRVKSRGNSAPVVVHVKVELEEDEPKIAMNQTEPGARTLEKCNKGSQEKAKRKAGPSKKEYTAIASSSKRSKSESSSRVKFVDISAPAVVNVMDEPEVDESKIVMNQTETDSPTLKRCNKGSQEKKGKGKAGRSNKQVSSSFKRPKNESRVRVKSEDNSAHAVNHVSDESEEDIRATFVLALDNVENQIEPGVHNKRPKNETRGHVKFGDKSGPAVIHIGNELEKGEPKTVMKRTEPGARTIQKRNKAYDPKRDPFYGFL